MKQVDEMPTSGQFVAVWSGLDGKIWSDTLRWIDGKIYSYEEFNDEGLNHNFTRLENFDFYCSLKAQYFIAD